MLIAASTSVFYEIGSYLASKNIHTSIVVNNNFEHYLNDSLTKRLIFLQIDCWVFKLKNEISAIISMFNNHINTIRNFNSTRNVRFARKWWKFDYNKRKVLSDLIWNIYFLKNFQTNLRSDSIGHVGKSHKYRQYQSDSARKKKIRRSLCMTTSNSRLPLVSMLLIVVIGDCR
jgi:hypothetical protein